MPDKFFLIKYQFNIKMGLFCSIINEGWVSRSLLAETPHRGSKGALQFQASKV